MFICYNKEKKERIYKNSKKITKPLKIRFMPVEERQTDKIMYRRGKSHGHIY